VGDSPTPVTFGDDFLVTKKTGEPQKRMLVMLMEFGFWIFWSLDFGLGWFWMFLVG